VLDQFATFGVVESVKAVSDLYAPLSGEVSEVNGALAGNPELVNAEPFGEGWMIRVQIADPAQLDGLLDAEAYERLTAGG
jgi:glycine cleavage system H protein